MEFVSLLAKCLAASSMLKKAECEELKRLRQIPQKDASDEFV